MRYCDYSLVPSIFERIEMITVYERCIMYLTDCVSRSEIIGVVIVDYCD